MSQPNGTETEALVNLAKDYTDQDLSTLTQDHVREFRNLTTIWRALHEELCASVDGFEASFGELSDGGLSDSQIAVLENVDALVWVVAWELVRARAADYRKQQEPFLQLSTGVFGESATYRDATYQQTGQYDSASESYSDLEGGQGGWSQVYLTSADDVDIYRSPFDDPSPPPSASGDREPPVGGSGEDAGPLRSSGEPASTGGRINRMVPPPRATSRTAEPSGAPEQRWTKSTDRAQPKQGERLIGVGRAKPLTTSGPSGHDRAQERARKERQQGRVERGLRAELRIPSADAFFADPVGEWSTFVAQLGKKYKLPKPWREAAIRIRKASIGQVAHDLTADQAQIVESLPQGQFRDQCSTAFTVLNAFPSLDASYTDFRAACTDQRELDALALLKTDLDKYKRSFQAVTGQARAMKGQAEKGQGEISDLLANKMTSTRTEILDALQRWDDREPIKSKQAFNDIDRATLRLLGTKLQELAVFEPRVLKINQTWTRASGGLYAKFSSLNVNDPEGLAALIQDWVTLTKWLRKNLDLL